MFTKSWKGQNILRRWIENCSKCKVYCMMKSEELIYTTHYLQLWTDFHINRCRYKEVFHFTTKTVFLLKSERRNLKELDGSMYELYNIGSNTACYEIFVAFFHICSSSSSCSGKSRFWSLFLVSLNEIGPSISSSVVLSVFVLLVYIVVLI